MQASAPRNPCPWAFSYIRIASARAQETPSRIRRDIHAPADWRARLDRGIDLRVDPVGNGRAMVKSSIKAGSCRHGGNGTPLPRKVWYSPTTTSISVRTSAGVKRTKRFACRFRPRSHKAAGACVSIVFFDIGHVDHAWPRALEVQWRGGCRRG